jgi:hypothetical protein
VSRFLRGALVLVKLLIGTLGLLLADNWLWVGLAMFMYGMALRVLAFDPWLSGVRHAIRLSTMRAFRISMSLYILAGALAVIGAIASLEPALAAFVVAGGAGWMTIWSWALRRSWNEPEPELSAL